VHNATAIEKRGTPAVVICTGPFAQTGAAMAKRQGYSSYRIALVDHPISNLTAAEVRQRAQQALPQVLSIALGQDIAAEL